MRMRKEPGMTSYRAMIFDIGGVLVPLRFQRAYASMEAACGLPGEEIRRRMAASGLSASYERGEMSDAEFTAAVCRLLDADLTEEQFRTLWCSIFDVETIIPVEFLAQLRQRHRMLLLSNTNGIHVARLRAKCAAMEHFDDAVLSYEVGWMKPDGRMFEEAVRRAGCNAGQCFYTDDIEANVEAARSVGIDAVLFEGFDGLRAAIQARGIL